MRIAGQILQKILAIVGALKLPGDAKELWSYVRSHLYPLTWSAAVAVVIAFAGWWREAPFWQVALAIFVLAILVYCFVFTLGVLRQRGAFDGRTNRPEPDEGRETETQVPRTLNDEDLKQRCRDLSNILFEFYRREQEDLDKRLRYTVHAAEPDRSQIRREATARHNRKTMNRYGEQPGSDVLALSHDLAQGDWITPKDQRRFENFAKPKDIQYIAQRLAAICVAQRLAAICDRPSLTHGERPSQQDSAIFWNQEKRARL